MKFLIVFLFYALIYAGDEAFYDATFFRACTLKELVEHKAPFFEELTYMELSEDQKSMVEKKEILSFKEDDLEGIFVESQAVVFTPGFSYSKNSLYAKAVKKLLESHLLTEVIMSSTSTYEEYFSPCKECSDDMEF